MKKKKITKLEIKKEDILNLTQTNASAIIGGAPLNEFVSVKVGEIYICDTDTMSDGGTTNLPSGGPFCIASQTCWNECYDGSGYQSDDFAISCRS
ncbi:hypothetical protein HZP98_06770 [Elizabethkingia anophelis]|uniref:class I lanthipeptide n=1 Tax=Elizabethkingia anophelis TaxID=1117645 RepID=UPI0006656254|nr:class I lanthipeptide [Elizabethkingia anophelis]MCT3919510.1 hypothetical protein [Elizabethkingia anophelis]MCT3951865.1 hypothetical protein [Elizabethkingia anophelis]MCT3955274.1 hypothetical protein [Elizabethkingia anophelis]MCT3986964.1 hypothetical protein [Elizabethkingia anophelis]MCT4065401.1 hypothetical protein [Elizabethkingia anophelis]